DGRIVAHAPLKQLSSVTEYVGLGNVRITKRIKNRFIENFLSVSHTVYALPAVTYNLVRKPSGAKGHSGMRPQHSAFDGLLQSTSHGRLRIRSEERRIGKECRARRCATD